MKGNNFVRSKHGSVRFSADLTYFEEKVEKVRDMDIRDTSIRYIQLNSGDTDLSP